MADTTFVSRITQIAATWLNQVNRQVFASTSAASIRSLDKTIYTRTRTLGYYTPGDGGGGDYWLDPSDTTSADNGGTVFVASDGGRWKLTDQRRVDLRQFGAKCDGATNDTSLVRKAVAAGVPLLIRGRCFISASDIVLESNFSLQGSNKNTDGFVLDTPPAGGGVHGYFLLGQDQNVDNVTFEGLSFWGNYSSDTYTGGLAYPVIHAVAKSGVFTSNLRFFNLNFWDIVVAAIGVAPQSGGSAFNIWVDKCSVDVTVTLDKGSQTANLYQGILEFIGWPGHATSYGTVCIERLWITNCRARGVRTCYDIKRGHRQVVITNIQTEDMWNCHGSVDGSFDITIDNITGKQVSPLITGNGVSPTNFLEMQGENIFVTNLIGLCDPSNKMIVAGVYVTAYGALGPGDTPHQSKHVYFENIWIEGVAQSAVRFTDIYYGSIRNLTAYQISSYAVTSEMVTYTPDHLIIDDIKVPSGVGITAVSLDPSTLHAKIGVVSGPASLTTATNFLPLYRPSDDVVSDKSMTLVAGVLPGWTTSNCAISQASSGGPVQGAQGILLNDSDASNVGSLDSGGIPVVENDVVYFRAFAAVGTSTHGCSVRFRERAGTTPILDYYVALTASSLTENVASHVVVDATCTNVIVSLIPAGTTSTASNVGTSSFYRVAAATSPV